jgi:hypothetical protein
MGEAQERLRDAAAALGQTVQREDIPPLQLPDLAAPDARSRRRRLRARSRRRSGAWLVPAAAAAGVVTTIAVVVFVSPSGRARRDAARYRVRDLSAGAELRPVHARQRRADLARPRPPGELRPAPGVLVLISRSGVPDGHDGLPGTAAAPPGRGGAGATRLPGQSEVRGLHALERLPVVPRSHADPGRQVHDPQIRAQGIDVQAPRFGSASATCAHRAGIGPRRGS